MLLHKHSPHFHSQGESLNADKQLNPAPLNLLFRRGSDWHETTQLPNKPQFTRFCVLSTTEYLSEPQERDSLLTPEKRELMISFWNTTFSQKLWIWPHAGLWETKLWPAEIQSPITCSSAPRWSWICSSQSELLLFGSLCGFTPSPISRPCFLLSQKKPHFYFFLTIHDCPKHSQIQTKLLCLLMEFLQLSSALHRPPRALAVPWHCPSTLSGAEPLPLSISALGTTFLCLCITGSISFQMSSENPSLSLSFGRRNELSWTH